MMKFGAAVLVAGVLALGACSSDGDDKGSSAPPSSNPPAASSGSTAAPSSSSEASSSSRAGGLSSALLTATDLGSGYSGGPRASDEKTKLPCSQDKPPLNEQVMPSDKADADFKNAAGDLQISESVNEYSDEQTAQKAYTAAVAGFNCSAGTIEGQQIKIVKKQARAGSGTDALQAWDFGDGKQFKGTAVAGRVGKRFVGLTFVVPATASGNVDLTTIVSKALTKAKAS